MFVGTLDEVASAHIGVAIALGDIAEGDETFLLVSEEAGFRACPTAVKRRSASARRLARKLLEEVGYPDWPLERRIGHGPAWPPGVVGSLSHCDTYAAAAIATTSTVCGLGIDIEDARPLSSDLTQYIASPRELPLLTLGPLAGRALVCAKEAAYKSLYPADKIFLDWHDIQISSDFKKARARYGAEVELTLTLQRSIVALAIRRD